MLGVCWRPRLGLPEDASQLVDLVGSIGDLAGPTTTGTVSLRSTRKRAANTLNESRTNTRETTTKFEERSTMATQQHFDQDRAEAFAESLFDALNGGAIALMTSIATAPASST